jgi:hypothetical protein
MEKYNIKIRTKEGTYEYEQEDLKDVDLILLRHPNYQEIRAEQIKPKQKVKKIGNNNSNRVPTN